MHFFKKQPMLSHVKAEHLRSIRDKFEDLMVSVGADMTQTNTDRLLKALAVYILNGGVQAAEGEFDDEDSDNE